MPVENCEIIFFLNVDALADMLVYDENHSPEMIKGRGKYQLPNIPHLYLPRASPKQQFGARQCRARFFGGSFGSFQRWTAIPSQQ